MKTVASILGALFITLGVLAFLTIWEPQSVAINAHWFAIFALALGIGLVWYASRPQKQRNH